MLNELSTHEIELLRGKVHAEIMSQKPGLYTIWNQIVFKIDKWLDSGVKE